MKKAELQTMVISELKALAKKMKVKLSASARKSEIVDQLAAAFRQKTSAAVSAKKDSPVQNTGAKKTSVSRTTAVRRKTTPKASPAPKPPVQKPVVETPPVGREWKMPPGTEEPLMAQERVSDAKYYTGPAKDQAISMPYVELSAGYGEEKIELMVRDPYLAYAYWEMTPSRIQREKTWFGWNGKLTVRIYDVTGVQFDGRNAVGYFDQEVQEIIGSWYFDLGRPTHSFVADIGLLTPEGRFLTLARSNSVTMPRDGVSDVVDEEWMLADEEFWKLYGFPGGPSSAQLQEMLRIRRSQQVTSPGLFSRERFKK